MIYPYFINRGNYYTRYIRRYNENTGIIDRILSPISFQDLTFYKTLNNYTFQYYLKKYNEYSNIFDDYHYNVNIVNIGYMFLPTNSLVYTGNLETDNIVNQINIYINNVDSSVYKYIQYIKTKTYYKPLDNSNSFDDSFYMNDMRYKSLKVISTNFDYDVYNKTSTIYLNLFNTND